MPARVGNLPAELTSFVGRRRELGDAKRLLSSARLVTLTGTGGVGKTRLALRVAADVRRAFPDGVWLVELANLRDPLLLPNAVAAALGLRGTADPAGGLAEYLEDKRLLLLLDNCEHLADECAALVAKLLAASSGTRVLATSRHTLHVEGEHILPVDPLTVPDRGDTDEAEAVTLFADRAAAVVPGFALTEVNRAAVSWACQRLEGIPLAIELAAVRLRVLSVDQLVQRLDDRFGLLIARRRAAQPRQQTLEAAIEWSFELCSPTEQRLWTQLSVLPGGFDLDAAEHVCALGRDTVLEGVAGLVDKSVLSRQDGTFGRHAWYRMLETVREYAGAKLAEGDERAVRARLVERYVRLARQYRAEGFGPRQLDWIARLRREHPNLRAVLDHCLSDPEQASRGLDIAASLWNFWYGGGLVPEGYRYLRRGLAVCRERTMVRARALYGLSGFATQLGVADASGMLAELAELATELDDDRLRAGHAECAGLARFFAGDRAGGAELLERALAGYRAAGDALLVFDTLILLAAAYFFLDDPRGAVAAEEALALTERHEARWSRGYALWAVALHRWLAGEHTVAAELLTEAVALRLADRTLLAFLLEALAWCRSADGEHEQATWLLGAATAVWRRSGARVDEMTPYRDFDEQCATLARAALGAEAYEAAFAEGRGPGLDEVVRHVLREKGSRSSGPARTAELGGLTRREREVAELVASGMSNRDIASALVVSRRTVESHVQNTLVKLGFTSRAQIASWVTRQSR
jgi:predicted ATPase/DNA-binding CsgD family transcriptional regulator